MLTRTQRAQSKSTDLAERLGRSYAVLVRGLTWVGSEGDGSVPGVQRAIGAGGEDHTRDVSGFRHDRPAVADRDRACRALVRPNDPVFS